MDDNISHLRLAADNKNTPAKCVYSIYHYVRNPDDVINSVVEGFGMANDIAFFVVDDAYVTRILIPMSRIVYIESSPVVEAPDKSILN